MKKLLLISIGLIIGSTISAQVVTTNRNSVGMEHNILFSANSRYTVTQTGSATLNLEYLFDGKFLPSYTSTAPSVSNPTVVLIENIPGQHTQQHAVVGWSTRWWAATRFKIEGYDVYYGTPSWKTLADYSAEDYSGHSFYLNIKSVAPGSYTKLKFTFYTASGTNGRLGVSELFFLHPEATIPYKGLLVSSDDSWKTSGSNLYYNSGNVGIGTNNPGAKLEVKSSGAVYSGTPSLLVKDITNRGTMFLESVIDKPTDFVFRNNNRFSWVISTRGSSENYALRFYSSQNGTSWYSSILSMLTNGNVGIGTSSPDQLLDLDDGGGIDGTSLIEFNARSWIGYASRSLYLKSGSGKSILFATDGDNEVMRINTNGNVGIGTTNPQTKLAVNGEITTKEVIVTMDGWSDFVFKNDYDLWSLEKVEEYIKEKGHLPEIPSTYEVEKNGIELGEMNARIIRKIEELTLYIIKINKVNQEMAKEIFELKKQVNQLKKNK